jgi:putative aldouronate transport system substrate-binding protein
MQSFMTMFGVPTLWRKNSDGSWTYYIETDEYRQGLDYVRRVYAAGLFYPDSVSQTNLQQKENFFAGKYGMYTAGFPEIVLARQRCRSVDPKADAAVLTPPAAPGRKTNVWWGTAYSGYVAIPSSVKDPERIKELLRILDYLAASQFTYEGNFLTFGIDGQDNSPTNGLKALNQTGLNELGDLATIMKPSDIYYVPQEPSLAPQMQAWARDITAHGGPRPSLGLSSPTENKVASQLNTMIQDRVTRIMRGLDPLSALDTLISDWRKQGGDQISKEYAEAAQKLQH